MSVEADKGVRELISSARDTLGFFITSEWIELAPDVVRGIEAGLRDLPPGVSLGDAFAATEPVPPPSQPLLVEPIAPSASQSSAASSPMVAPPPLSATPSGSSGNTGPLGLDSDIEITARPSRPMPRKVPRKARIVTPPVDTQTSSVAAPQVVPEIALPSQPAPAEVSSAPVSTPAASTRSARKRSAADVSRGDGPPSDWKPCARCKHLKKGCAPDKEADPPYSACTLCLRTGKACEPFTSGAYNFGFDFDSF